jgi:hypothetical protein
MLENDNLTPISEWINSHEELIRFTYRNYKVWKEAKQPFHLGIQLKTKAKTWTAQSPYYDYGPIQKIKITFQNSNYLRPYENNCDILWWVRGSKVQIIDLNKLKQENQIHLEDNFGQVFTTEQVNNATIQILDTTEKINFPHKKSFHKYSLSYYRIKEHKEAWIFEIKYLEEERRFTAQYYSWKAYSKVHGVKNIQFKRNGINFEKAIHGEKIAKNLKKVTKGESWLFYSENANLTRPGWLSSYIKEKSVILFLSSLFSVQVPGTCNLVNNSSSINIDIEYNKENYYLHSNKLQLVTENKNDYIQKTATFEECLEFCHKNNEKLITKEEYDLYIST